MPDRTNEYQDEIYRRAAELVSTRECEVADYIGMHKSLHIEFCASLKIIATAWSEQSQKLACDDLAHVMFKAATEMAEFEYKRDMKVAAEKLAVERFYRMAEAA